MVRYLLYHSHFLLDPHHLAIGAFGLLRHLWFLLRRLVSIPPACVARITPDLSIHRSAWTFLFHLRLWHSYWYPCGRCYPGNHHHRKSVLGSTTLFGRHDDYIALFLFDGQALGWQRKIFCQVLNQHWQKTKISFFFFSNSFYCHDNCHLASIVFFSHIFFVPHLYLSIIVPSC